MLLDLETSLNLRSDSESVTQFVVENGGSIASDALDRGVYWLTLRPRRFPGETYVVRIAWQRYPQEPPSVKFATEIGGRVDVSSAWPMVPGYRPGSYDICQPFSREGFDVHPEWRTNAERWRGTGNPFRWVAEILQHDLDNRYQGRSG